MEKILEFLDNYYKVALKLVSDFDVTKEKKWKPADYLNELYVQMGHVYNVLYANENVDEQKRKIDNLGDELSDVILHIINLAKVMHVDMYGIKNYATFPYDDINGASILLGQLTEAVMEITSCRFKKNRVGFLTSYDFVKDRLYRLFILVFNIAQKYEIDLIKEFGLMVDDANGFLNRFRTQKNIGTGYVDIYNAKEELLGYCNVENAKKSGKYIKINYFHLFNPKKKSLYLPFFDNNIMISCDNYDKSVQRIREYVGLKDESAIQLISKRKCSDRKNKEFQYFYTIEMLKNPSKSMFYEIKLTDLQKILIGKKRAVKVNKKKITKDKLFEIMLDPFYLSILSKMLKKENVHKMKKDINSLYRKKKKRIKKGIEEVYFDNGQVECTKDYKKREIKYSVVLLNTDKNTNHYRVSLLMIYNHKPIPYLLNKEFKNKRGTEKYFNDLCNFVEENTNQDIVNACCKGLKNQVA